MWQWESLVSCQMDGLTDLTACSCRVGAWPELIDDTGLLAYLLLDHCFCGIDAERGIGTVPLARSHCTFSYLGLGFLGEHKRATVQPYRGCILGTGGLRPKALLIVKTCPNALDPQVVFQGLLGYGMDRCIG